MDTDDERLPPGNPTRHFQCAVCGRELWIASDVLLMVRSTYCSQWRRANGGDLPRGKPTKTSGGNCPGTLYPTPGYVLDRDGHPVQLLAPLAARTM